MSDSYDKAWFGVFRAIESVKRNAANSHFKNKYATLEQVIDTVRPVLIEHGFYFSQSSEPSEHGILVTTTFTHAPSGESRVFGTYVPLAKNDPQAAGSALTYGKRYGLLAHLGLPTEDDDGESAMGRGAVGHKELFNKLAAAKADGKDIAEYVKKSDLPSWAKEKLLK